MTLTAKATRQARKFIEQLQRSDAKHARQIIHRIDALCGEPKPPDSTALKGFEPYRRVDSGEYRIVYYVAGDDLRVILIGRRNDDAVYRLLRRLQ